MIINNPVYMLVAHVKQVESTASRDALGGHPEIVPPPGTAWATKPAIVQPVPFSNARLLAFGCLLWFVLDFDDLVVKIPY